MMGEIKGLSESTLRRDLHFIVLIREDRCQSKGSTFSSVILRPLVLVRLGIEPEPTAAKPGT